METLVNLDREILEQKTVQYMNDNLYVPANASSEARELLSLPTRQAEALFQSYVMDHQLVLISNTPNPRQKEALYELVPDCTELIQSSVTEDVLQVLDLHLGTGLSSVMISCLSADQFEEIMDIVLWRDGKLDEEALDVWLFELINIEPEELSDFLYQIDVTVLAEMLRGRIEIAGQFRAMQIEAGLMDPTSELITYAEDRTRDICVAVWEADEELFIRLLHEIFDLNEADPLNEQQRMIQLQSEREVRVEERDQSVGIQVTEEQLREKVDLGQLDLQDDDSSAE